MRVLSVATELHKVALPKRGRVPLAQPQRTGPEHVQILTATLTTDAGFTGRGYSVLLGAGAESVRALVETETAKLVLGENPQAVERLLAKAETHYRDLGFAGTAARGYAALDIAFWDLKSQAAGVSPAELLGAAKPGVPFFTSDIVGTNWDPAEAAKAAKATIAAGGLGIRLEIGSDQVEADAERARELHDAVGEEAWVGLAAGGRYDLNTALALAHFFEDQGIDWFEDPVNPADPSAYARLTAKLEMPVAVGSTFDRREDFFRVIRDGLARIIRPDLSKLGGITPFLKVAAVAEAYGISVSPVRMPEICMHLGAALPAVTLIDRVSWASDLFPNCTPTVASGKLIPPTAMGFGL